MDLGRGFDKVLEVGPEEEVTKIDEFAMVLITPQRFFLPRTDLPLMMMLRSEPTMANGIMFLMGIYELPVMKMYVLTLICSLSCISSGSASSVSKGYKPSSWWTSSARI